MMSIATLQLMLCGPLFALRGGHDDDYTGDEEDDDLSPNGAIAQRIRAQLAAQKPLPDARFVIAETTDGRGKGLFVGAEPIEAGAYLFDYGGRLIEQDEYNARYTVSRTGGVQADYAVGMVLDDGRSVYVDAADAAESNLARYMNHAEPDLANCVAWTVTQPEPRVMLFAGDALAAGSEMVWDYGREYWTDRTDQI